MRPEQVGRKKGRKTPWCRGRGRKEREKIREKNWKKKRFHQFKCERVAGKGGKGALKRRGVEKKTHMAVAFERVYWDGESVTWGRRKGKAEHWLTSSETKMHGGKHAT